MIGLVLAAGAGRRLRPLTDDIPKTLAPVDGETTILDIALANLAAVGLADVTVVVGYAARSVTDQRADFESRHGVRLSFVDNPRAEEWNNAYSLWLARDAFADGALIVNGDTVHPADVERDLLAARGGADLLLALDTAKDLADEEMKVVVDGGGRITRISKRVEPSTALGEYIGVSLVEPSGSAALAAALEATWRENPDQWYEDGYQRLIDERTANLGFAEIAPGTTWVEVDDHADLARAREIACLC